MLNPRDGYGMAARTLAMALLSVPSSLSSASLVCLTKSAGPRGFLLNRKLMVAAPMWRAARPFRGNGRFAC